MTFVLFYVETGEKIDEFESETDARKQLRERNRRAGWERINASWSEGYEREWCTNGNTNGYGPYGITEWERWQEKFFRINKSLIAI